MAVPVFSLELASGALTRWEGPSPVSLCRQDREVVFADDTGLYRFGGDTDNGEPIAARLTLPPTDGGTAGPKRLRAVRLTGRLADDIDIEATSESGAALVGTAASTGQDGLPGVAVARLGRGQGRFWRVELRSDGGDLDIGALALDLVPLDRRLG